ncbi:MAG: DNA repair protein RecN (Recombination protein N) [Spirochaetes bacterium]|nr:MAG: DNA repair protein RecN (Recombination protein N) [Spirochaetota bacterium]
MAMLERLLVRDFALIESADLEFSSGLTIFTGETGAGKSLAVGAIGFLLGAKADVSSIREGADECVVSGILRIDNNGPARLWLQKHEIKDEDGRVALRRGIRSNGRSYAYLQNVSVTRADLASFTSAVVDIHGQHEHQSLLDEAHHQEIIDAFADLIPERESYQDYYVRWTSLVREYRKQAKEAEEKQNQRDYLQFTLREIKAAKPLAGEDEVLVREEKILSQHEKLFESVKNALNALHPSNSSQDGLGALGLLKKAHAEIRIAQEIDSSLLEILERAESAFLEIDDIVQSLGEYREKLRFEPSRLQDIESRLAELRRLKKKYGPTLDDVIARASRDASLLESFDTWEKHKETMEKEISNTKAITLQKAELLSIKRRQAALSFQVKAESILSTLGMPYAKLPISIERRVTEQGKLLLEPGGMDAISILIAPNPGESPRPLSKIASGGELSRVALAIKTILSAKDNVNSLIFDEIDSGIGGEVAVSVGEYLRKIALHKQVFCVTHLASIAVKAGTHFRVDKIVQGERTVTVLERLSGGARAEEVSRMLSGQKHEVVSLAHAARLLDENSS